MNLNKTPKSSVIFMREQDARVPWHTLCASGTSYMVLGHFGNDNESCACLSSNCCKSVSSTCRTIVNSMAGDNLTNQQHQTVGYNIHYEAIDLSHSGNDKGSCACLSSGSHKSVSSTRRTILGVMASGDRMNTHVQTIGKTFRKFRVKRNRWPLVCRSVPNAIERYLLKKKKMILRMRLVHELCI
jgi:ribosomal protein L2